MEHPRGVPQNVKCSQNKIIRLLLEFQNVRLWVLVCFAFLQVLPYSVILFNYLLHHFFYYAISESHSSHRIQISDHHQNKDLCNVIKHCHGNISVTTAVHIFLDIKLYFRQSSMVVIPESTSEWSKCWRYLEIGVDSQVSSMTGVVLLPRKTADCLWR